jgi:hypothetical protein
MAILNERVKVSATLHKKWSKWDGKLTWPIEVAASMEKCNKTGAFRASRGGS